ncbi:NEP1-interacting protein-like 2 [Prosopis cineraria]|uniref:NEP1-interacting protein-like 2 n=1 Tax=Prosopis cineraria TaxID=364024 RepID=UPI0024104FD9|nr:NEP1-interacting protein-like 2 [Prosopis cineraria]
MPDAAEASESQHSKCTRPRTQFSHLISQTNPDPQIPSLPHSTRCKSTISSILSASSHDACGETARPNLNTNKKKTNFSAVTLRGFGCTAGASRQVSLPALIRTSADWQQTKARKEKHRRSGAKNSVNGQGVFEGSNSGSVGCVDSQDVWCGPGIGFSADVAAHADCVVARKNGPTRGKTDLENMTHSHREMMLLQGSLLMGGRLNSRDHFRDWRLDVDNMSYEQLLELGERIGCVNTGLKEDEIRRCIRKFKLSKFNKTSKSQVENKCSICQEEYEADDEVGRLSCEHDYHFRCLRQWLAQKNCCPVCKQEVVSRHSVAKS